MFMRATVLSVKPSDTEPLHSWFRDRFQVAGDCLNSNSSLIDAPPVFLSPFWAGAAHVVQLGPIWIEQRRREPAPPPRCPIEDAAQRREQTTLWRHAIPRTASFRRSPGRAPATRFQRVDSDSGSNEFSSVITKAGGLRCLELDHRLNIVKAKAVQLSQSTRPFLIGLSESTIAQ